MLYSFFDERSALRLDPFGVQLDGALNNGATGIAILGLGTQVSLLTEQERIEVLETVASHMLPDVPLLVTVYGETPEDHIRFCKTALDAGATGLILQPPSKPISETELVNFFSEVFGSIDCDMGVQNAPDFLANSLGTKSLVQLAEQHTNFSVAKLECTAIALEPVVRELEGRVMVFNGRCGLELPDNLRAGALGMIPSVDTVDKTSAIFSAFTQGEAEEAERLYREVLPTISYIMQGIPQFLIYGKRLAAMRLGIEFGSERDPTLVPTDFGLACLNRFAEELGKLKN